MTCGATGHPLCRTRRSSVRAARTRAAPLLRSVPPPPSLGEREGAVDAKDSSPARFPKRGEPGHWEENALLE